MQVIFSCEDKTYMWWQAELLRYSFSRTGMTAALTALVSPDPHGGNSFSGNVLRVQSYAAACDGPPLMVLNKPGSIAEWAALDSQSDETVLIVDPDTVFHQPIPNPGSIPTGQAYSEAHEYMLPDSPQNKLVLERHCPPSCRALVQPVGIYILIARSSLVELANRWLQRSIEIASDKTCRDALAGTGWLSDMWGYTIAAAELGIRHHICGLSQVTGSNSLARPLTHYCYPLMANPQQRWHPSTQDPLLWSKWHYQPWAQPPNPSLSVAEGRFLLQQLSELVRLKAEDAQKTLLDPSVSPSTLEPAVGHA